MDVHRITTIVNGRNRWPFRSLEGALQNEGRWDTIFDDTSMVLGPNDPRLIEWARAYPWQVEL